MVYFRQKTTFDSVLSLDDVLILSAILIFMTSTQGATKADISVLRTDIRQLERSTKSDISALKTEMSALKEDMKKLDGKLDKLQATLDGFVSVVDDLRTDNIVGTHQTKELQMKVNDHEKRLQHVES